MKKRYSLALMGVLIFAIVLLAGCGGSNGTSQNNTNTPDSSTIDTENSNSNNNESNASNEPNSNESNASNDEEPVAVTYPDLGGMTVRIGANYDATPQENSPIGAALVEKQKEVEEAYNVKIEYLNIPQGEIIELFTSSVLAGEPFVEIMRMDHFRVVPTMTESGLVLPLNDLVDLENQNNLPMDLMEAVSTYDDQIYGLNTVFPHSYGVYYNKTLFNKLGLPDIRAMADAGTWNWDSFLDVAKQATKDTDGDGAIDTWGMTAFQTDFATNLVVSNGGQFITDDGQVVMDSPETIEALNFLERLFQIDKVVRFENAGDWGEQRKFFAEGNVAMMPGFAYDGGGLKNNMADYEWSYLPFPKGPNATNTEYVSAYFSVPMYYIPKGVEHPEAMAQIWLDLQLWDMQEDTLRAQLEAWFEFEEDIETAMTASQNVLPLNLGTYPGFPLKAVLESIIKGEATPAVAVEKVKQEAQATVDAVLKK